MSDEAIINTLETLGVTPRFVLQHNAVSRSIQNLSATAKKLTAMAMALLPPDLSSYTVSFTFAEFCKALGFGDGGEQYRLFDDASTECMQCVIYIETGKTAKGKTSWEKFTWFEYSKFDTDTGICTMIFSTRLAKFLKELKRVYARINLQDLGKLQSKYALRYFEMAKSYESLAGKDGNRAGTWYFERTIQELRQLLAVPQKEYPRTDNFKKRVVEEPVKEINGAGIGVVIKTTGVKQGRNLKAIRFDCKQTAQKVPAKGGRKKKSAEQVELPELTMETRGDKELEHLKELYPDEFAALYAEEMDNPSFLPSESGFRKAAASMTALVRLRERHGIVK